MNDKLVYLTSANFEEEVKNSAIPVLIDFWAEWCGPCKMIAPIFEQLADQYTDKVKFCKLNIDDEGVLALQYRVMSIPTLTLFKNGEAASKIVGVRPAKEISDWLDTQIEV